MTALKTLLSRWKTKSSNVCKNYQVKFKDGALSYHVQGDADITNFLKILASVSLDDRPPVFQVVSETVCLFLQIDMSYLETDSPHRLHIHQQFMIQLACRMITYLTHTQASCHPTVYRPLFLQKSAIQTMILFPYSQCTLDQVIQFRDIFIQEMKQTRESMEWEKVLICPRVGQRVLLPYCKTDRPQEVLDAQLKWCQDRNMHQEHSSFKFQPFYYHESLEVNEFGNVIMKDNLLEFWIGSQVNK